MKIIVKTRNNYGARTVYPVCDKAQLFARIAGTTTIRATDIDSIKKLGHTIEVQQETI